jgi:2-polyprenyl-6-methoxyphenol hydroxylase-like FAD-dependent oxidoreductase
MSEKLQIAIVGGGIGGLAAALALRARGLSVTIFEQASELREIGAGVSLFPNATLLLQRIDLADRIEKIGLADNRAREPDIARRTHRHIGGALDWYPKLQCSSC